MSRRPTDELVGTPPGGIGFVIRQTRQKGQGLFATRFFLKGALILELGGKKFRTQDVPPESFAMQIDDDLWLCSDGSLLDDRINHSCDPNTGFVRNDPALYALRDIQPGEELTWDYSTSISEPGWRLDCRCESNNCRGVVLPYSELSLECKRRLKSIVLRYLQVQG